MVVGGSEAPIIPVGLGGFVACRALSTRNDEPTKASRCGGRGPGLGGLGAWGFGRWGGESSGQGGGGASVARLPTAGWGRGRTW